MKMALQWVVPILLILAGPAFAADKDAKSADKAADKAPAAAEKVDLNTATEKELSQLPGITEARAKSIIKGRSYKSRDELVDRKILPKSVYDKIRGQLIVKPAK